MAANTGRTISRWTKVYIDFTDGVLAEIPVNSINGVGIECPDVDVSAWQDAIRNALVDTGACTITLTGPFDSSAIVAASGSAAAPTTSGSHTVLKALVGLNTPLAFGVCFGMRQYYVTGEPAFGLNFSAGLSGFLVKSYLPNPDAGTYTASLVVFGKIAPSWLDAIPSS